MDTKMWYNCRMSRHWPRSAGHLWQKSTKSCLKIVNKDIYIQNCKHFLTISPKSSHLSSNRVFSSLQYYLSDRVSLNLPEFSNISAWVMYRIWRSIANSCQITVYTYSGIRFKTQINSFSVKFDWLFAVECSHVTMKWIMCKTWSHGFNLMNNMS